MRERSSSIGGSSCGGCDSGAASRSPSALLRAPLGEQRDRDLRRGRLGVAHRELDRDAREHAAVERHEQVLVRLAALVAPGLDHEHVARRALDHLGQHRAAERMAAVRGAEHDQVEAALGLARGSRRATSRCSTRRVVGAGPVPSRMRRMLVELLVDADLGRPTAGTARAADRAGASARSRTAASTGSMLRCASPAASSAACGVLGPPRGRQAARARARGRARPWSARRGCGAPPRRSCAPSSSSGAARAAP